MNTPSYSDYSDYLIRILNASVYDVAVETPLEQARSLSQRTGNNILLKREDLQPVFSFKIRGAYNKMSKLSKDALARGIIAASAGNHAQGVALSAQRLGCRAVIVMPETTPQIKVDAVKNRGGEVMLKGVSYNDAYDYAARLAEEEGLTYIAPFDDPDVIAGQGTVGMEILRQTSENIHAIFVPVGGGGLAAGVAAFIKQVRPEIKIIGVQTHDSCCMKASIAEGRTTISGGAGKVKPNVMLFIDDSGSMDFAAAGKDRPGRKRIDITKDALNVVVNKYGNKVNWGLQTLHNNNGANLSGYTDNTTTVLNGRGN